MYTAPYIINTRYRYTGFFIFVPRILYTRVPVLFGWYTALPEQPTPDKTPLASPGVVNSLRLAIINRIRKEVVKR